MKQFLLFIGLFIFIQTVKSQTSYTWNGVISTAWNTPGNWTPNGIPGAADNITIVTGSNTCLLNASAGITNITITSGTLDLGGFALTVNGTTAIFTSGTVQNGNITVSGATTTTFGNGPVTMNCNVNITSATVTLRNTTFQNTTNITKTGASNDGSAGNNVFNGPVTMNNAGTGYLMMGNGNRDQFNTTATFNNTGSGSIYVAYNSANNIFGGVTTFNNTPAANTLIYVSWLSTGTTFNNNIVVSSTNGQGVQFCGGNATATATLSAAKTIGVGGSGFSTGTLLLRQFTQVGATAQNLTLTGTSNLTLGPSSSFGGAITFSSPTLYLNGSTFNGTTNLTKTGITGDWSVGGNTFNGVCNLTNSGSSYLLLGSTNPDIWNNDVTFTDNGSERLLPCWSSTGNQFNGNIYVNTSGSATGIQFCGGNTTATATLAATKTIQAGGTGLTAGYLYLKQFTQLGSAPINLTATGSSVLYLGPSSNFGGAFTATAPDIWAQGAIYNSAAAFTKTGGSSNHNNQYQNIFNSTCTINQQSGSGYFMLGYNSNDLFNDNITVTSTNSGGIYLGWTSGTGTPTLAAGKTMLVGGAGFSAGFLSLNTFTQLGNAPMNLTFTGANTSLTFARNSVIGGNLTTSTPDIYFNGCTFNGTTNCTKTGSAGDFGSGGNTFNGVCSIANSGSGFLVLGNSNPDIWNSDVTFTDNGSERLLPGWGSTGNQFNGNIIVNTSGSATGIQFCGGNNTATAILAAGKTVQAGAGGLNTGYLILKQFTQLGSAPISLNLTGAATVIQVGPSSAIGGDFTVVSPRILLNGAVYSGIVNVTKTGATGEWSAGGNTFNSTLTVNHLGSGYFGFANGAADIYNGDVYANNNSTERIIFGNSPVGNQFNGNIILTQIGSSLGIAFGWSATTDETMAAGKTISIGAAGFNVGFLQIERFTQLGNSPMNLSLTGSASLTFGPTSIIGGNLTSSSPSLYFNGCTFNGTVNSTKTGLTNDNSNGNNIFNGVTTITNNSAGQLLLGNGNVDQFNNTATFNNTGSNNFYIGYNSPNNIFGGVTTFNNAPSANTGIYVSWLSAGTIFNDNIVVTSTSGQGVQFCGGNATATATLSATKTISVGAGGFSTGTLLLRQFTQIGATAQNLTLTGISNLTFGPSSSFDGNVTTSSPSLFFNGCTFNNIVNSIKTGVTNDGSSGNNIFNGAVTMTNSGAGYLLFGNGNRDQFNTTATFNNTGSNSIYVAYNSANNIFGGVTTFNNTPTANTLIYVSWLSTGTIFNDNIVTTSTNGQGVQFCGGNAIATATLSAAKTISVGAGGFSTGTLLLRQFTQIGATAQSLTLTGTSNLTFGPSSSFGGNVTTVSPTLFFNGCNFTGTVMSTKNGGTNDGSIGNNIFNGAFSITNTGAGYFMMGNGSPDLWQSTATFNNLSTGQHMYIAYNSTGNIFNGDVFFNNQPASNGLWIYPNNNGINTQFNGNISVINVNGAGVYFGSGTGTASFASGKTISVGAGGFNFGALIFKSFTQTGSGIAQNIITTGTSYIQYGPSASFDEAVTSSSPGLFFNGCTFNGSVNCTKTGTSNDQSQGNNIFNGSSIFTNNGTGYLLMTATTPDAYNSNVTFIQNSTGPVYPNYNGNSTYAGNLAITSPAAAAITFGSNTGTATFSGASGQTISATGGTPIPVFTRMVINNTGSGVTLNNTSINVSKNLTLTSGLLNTTTTYILTMLNGSTTAAGTALSTSYVNGPMRYQKSSAGATTLNFPIGNSPDCRPVVLTVNHTTGNLYTYQAQLFNASAVALGYTLPITVDKVSEVHYYTISRVNAASVSQPILELSGNQTIQLFFGSNDVVRNGGTLTVVKNTYTATTKWIDIGGTGGPVFTGSNLSGSITSTSLPTAFNSFSTFALGDVLGGNNILPIELLYFHAQPDNNKVDLTWATAVESNNSYFTIEKSRDGFNFEFVQKVNSEALNGSSSVTLNYIAQDENPYSGVSYYRLKQTDLDGNYKYSKIVSVNFDKNQVISVYPNPTTGTIFISGVGINENSLRVEWLDVSGRIVLHETASVQNGIATLHTNLNTGIYLLRFMSSDGSFKIQSVIIRK